MARSRRGPTSRVLALVVLLAACARPQAPGTADGAPVLSLRFEDARQPAAFNREGLGRREAEDSPEGLWAVVAGLPRPERAVVVNLESGAEVTVALFAARGGARATEIRLSPQAADALGIAARPAQVRITALRREPRLAVPDARQPPGSRAVGRAAG